MILKRAFIAFALLCAALGGPTHAAQNSIVTPATSPDGHTDFGTFVGSYLNPALRSIYTCNLGTTPPTNGTAGAPESGACWWDTSTTPWVLKYYDSVQWVSLASLNAVSHAISFSTSVVPVTASGTTYTITDASRGNLITLSNAGAVAVTLPQAGAASQFAAGWYADYRYTGSATATVTPTTSTIDGASSFTIRPGQFISIVSDGTNYVTTLAQQPYDAELAALAGLTSSAGKVPYFTGAATAATFDSTSFGRSVSNVADAAALRTLAGSVIGTNVQAWDADLDALAGVTSAAGSVPYFTGAATASTFASTSFGRSVSNVADAAALRTLAGSVIGTNVQAWDADLDALAAFSSTGFAARTASNAWAQRTHTGTANEITVTNGDGVSGNPTYSLPSALTFTGKTVTGGSYASPALTGTPTAPTATGGTNTTQVATTAFVQSAVVSATTGVSSIAGNTGAFTLGAGLTNSTNDIRVSLSAVTNSLSGNVALSNIANYFDGPSVAQGATGTWFASGTVTYSDATASQLYCKLWDGTTVIASADNTAEAGFIIALSLSGYIASPAGNIRISCRNAADTGGSLLFNQTGLSKDSTISAFRIQ